MVKFEKAIPYKVDDNLEEALLSNLSFVSSDISRATVDRNRSMLCYFLTDHSKQADIDRLLGSLLEKLEPASAADGGEVLFEQQGEAPRFQGDAFASLVESGEIKALANGVYAFRGNFLRLMRGLDRRVLELAKTQNAQDLALPVTTPIPLLQRSHFFDRTPQFANFICEVEAGGEKLSQMAATLRDPDGGTVPRESLKNPGAICRSAVCLGAYCLHENEILREENYRCYTVFGPVFRNEGLAVASLERLQEFSMREIVYFGSPEYVRVRLAECVNWFRDKMRELDLTGCIRAASDPFFAERFRPLQYFQLASQSKFEVRWVIPHSGQTVSVGSLNSHGEHFTKAFDIRLANGEFAATGCVGFGYERFAFLIVAQFGTEFSRWPAPLRQFFYLNE